MTRHNRFWNTGAACLAISLLVLASACTSKDERDSNGGEKAAPAAATVSPEMLLAGEATYKANCIACHGEKGRGDGPAAGVMKPPPRDHTDRAYMDTLTDDDLKKVIVIGGAIKGRPLMPSHPQISGKKLDELIAHVRSLSRGQS